VEQGRYADLRRLEAFTAKTLYALDARGAGSPLLADVDQLTAAATAAVDAGSGHVLNASHVIVPNGAVTLVLILAESHLSIHTWPEEDLVAVDLFSCGSIDGPRVLAELVSQLQLTEVRTHALPRGLPSG
jgi:S-adenosylmethionine decarboxylase